MSLLDLPDELWDHITVHLNLYDLMQVSQVSRQCWRCLATPLRQRRQQLPWRLGVDYGVSTLTGDIEKIYAVWVKVGWFSADMCDHYEKPDNLISHLKHYRSVREGTGGPMLEAILRERHSCKVLLVQGEYLDPVAIVPYETPPHFNLDVADIEVGSLEYIPKERRLPLDYGRLKLHRYRKGVSYRVYHVPSRKRKHA